MIQILQDTWKAVHAGSHILYNWRSRGRAGGRASWRASERVDGRAGGRTGRQANGQTGDAPARRRPVNPQIATVT